ncbi:MAG TPA: ABC transporter ATP-binding protein, partial [Nitrososphaerales archaeon]|nr:ABC transporter ATP-binding protein [Nitrososphaerales archaeon]
VKAVDNASFDIGAGEVISLVGESGCGKSTLGKAVIGLLPNTAKVSGSLVYKGTDLVGLDQGKMTKYRGTEISMIFQEPMSSLNPVFRVGDQLAEAIQIRRARKGPKDDKPVKDEAIEYLAQVKITDPRQVSQRYPHELSGGMRQRVMIAMSLAQRPSLLIADEPTTALDVTTQAQILTLMSELTHEYDMSLLFITHDLGVAGMVASRIIVLYAGEIVEDSPVSAMFTNTFHPYAKGLMGSTPTSFKGGKRIEAIKGGMPNLSQTVVGCKFSDRCPRVFERCVGERPPLIDVESGRKVRCFLYGG